MNPVLIERLTAIAAAARNAGHGGKGAIYQAGRQELGMSHGTLLRKLKEVSLMETRKQRSDAGQSALTRDEAMYVSALLMESARKTTKRLYSMTDALEALRANRMIRAEAVDKATGELRTLSESAVHRALRMYGLHPDQLLAPAPVTELASAHPNHVWQIDASLCVLYYLKPSVKEHNGLRIMGHAEFYKNKPRNIARITADRVWSYEITDHASGWIYVEYVMGAESGENLCSVLINAMQERGNGDLMHGTPRILNLDPGSANTAAMTKNLCKSLGIEMLVHKPGNARATGQVENARNIIERKFEPGLKFQPVNSLEELNALATKWRIHFNSTAVHSRHKKTRNMAWMAIREDQLTKAPSVEVCRELAISTPESRKVNADLTVSFRGPFYDVSSVPGVMVGEKLMVTRNPWRDDAAQVVYINDEGHEVFQIVPLVKTDENGFRTDAPQIGQSFKRQADTPAQKALKEIEQLITGTDSVEAAAAARKAKNLPLFKDFDPYKHIDNDALPTYLPRRGQVHGLTAPVIEFPPVSHVEAAKRIKAAIRNDWQPSYFSTIKERFPAGVPEEAIDTLISEFSTLINVQPLRVVAGGMS